jgi:hypothetical protein
MAFSIADVGAIHREQWPDQRVVMELFESTAFLGLMKRDRDLGYAGKHIALQYGRPQGRSRQFANAQANVSSPKFEDFYIRPLDDYAVVEIEGKLWRSFNTASEAFVVDVLERLTNGAMSSLKQSISMNACGTGTGVRGRITTVGTGIAESGGNTTFRLANANDIKNIEAGMWLVAGTTPTGALRDSGAKYQVIGVNYGTADVTVSGTAITDSSWAEDDYIFQDGDAANGSLGTGVYGPMIAGFLAWIPTTAPTSTDSFLGVNRSAYPEHLAGWRFTASGLGTTTIYETLMKSLSGMSRVVGKSNAPRIALLNPEDKGDLLAELDAANKWTETISRRGREVDIYYDGIMIESPIGKIEIFDEPQFERGISGLVNPDSWHFATIGEQPAFVDEDGQRFLRKGTTDDFEARMVVHPQVYCDAPLFNANVTLPT